jgi:carboxyl-terminal processing protease
MRLWPVALAALTFLVGAEAAAAQPAPAAPSPETLKALIRLGEALGIAEREHVTPIDEVKAIDVAAHAMLASFDSRSEFLTAAEFDRLRRGGGDGYVGVGLTLSRGDAGLIVMAPLDGGPAARADVRFGDLIVAIDGHQIGDEGLTATFDRLRGPVGSTAILSLVRDHRRFDVVLTRAFVELRSVRISVREGLGVIRISEFNASTDGDVVKAVSDLLAQSPALKGVVLDLRNNPGGLLASAEAVASDFLDGGVVVTQTGRGPQDSATYRAKPGGDRLRGLPMVVLVNPGTGSGAEVVAAALQDNRRAAVVGLTTAGAGSIQTVFPLGGGGAIKLTTALYFRPSGQPIRRLGVTPDLAVARSAQEAARADIFDATRLENAIVEAPGGPPPPPAPPRAPAETPPAGYDAEHGDYQMDRALDLLRTRIGGKSPPG